MLKFNLRAVKGWENILKDWMEPRDDDSQSARDPKNVVMIFLSGIITGSTSTLRMCRFILLLIAFLNAPVKTFGQNEYNSWAFGNGLGVRFTDTDIVSINTNIDAPVSCTSIGDANGNLLLYSNSENIWNNRNEIINGATTLDANKLNYQSSLLVKAPGNNSIYYLFTTGSKPGSQNAVRLHTIDIQANGGAGALTSRNVVILFSDTETLEVTFHRNRKDLWLVVFDGGRVLSYPIKEGGIETPIVSANFNFVSTGAISINPAGNLLAIPSRKSGAPVVQLLDFNNESGSVQLQQPLLVGTNPGFSTRINDLAFSISGTILYVSLSDGTAPNHAILMGYNVELMRFLGSYFDANSYTFDLQLGSNGRMYFLNKPIDPVTHIPTVQLIEIACDKTFTFFESRVVMKFEGSDQVSLPSLNESTIKIDGNLHSGLPASIAICPNTPYQFTIESKPGINYEWTPSNGLSNSKIPDPTLTLAQAGTYTYNLKLSSPVTCASDTDTIHVVVNPSPAAFSINYEAVCSGDEGTLVAQNVANYQYNWNVVGGTIKSGQGTYALIVDWDRVETGSVKLAVTNEFGCTTEINQTVSLKPLPVAVIKGPPIVCPNHQSGGLQCRTAVAELSMVGEWRKYC